MQNKNHTPRKWTPYPWKWTNYTLSGPTGRIICNAAEVGRDINGDEEDKANQRLLSHAPMLINAIADILQCPTYSIGENLHPDFLRALHSAAHAYVLATGTNSVQVAPMDESTKIDDAIAESNYYLAKSNLFNL